MLTTKTVHTPLELLQLYNDYKAATIGKLLKHKGKPTGIPLSITGLTLFALCNGIGGITTAFKTPGNAKAADKIKAEIISYTVRACAADLLPAKLVAAYMLVPVFEWRQIVAEYRNTKKIPARTFKINLIN